MKADDRNALGRSGWVLAILLALLVFAYPLLLASRIPLLDPDEGLHAAIAQEMVNGGDWVVPKFLGHPFFDKPILYFWAEAVSLSLFGMSEAAVRLPGLLFGLLAMAATALAGWRMFGRTAGLVSALFYGAMVLPVALAQAAAHDVALVPFTTLAILMFWEADRAQSRRATIGCILAVGLLLGLSILTKGLVGVALVGIAYGGYLLLTQRLKADVCRRGAIALAIGAAIASTWYIAMELRNPGYLQYYFIDRHLLGFTTATQSHGHMACWYYLPLLLGGGLPWIIYLPVVIYDQRIKYKQRVTTESPPGATAGLSGSVPGHSNSAGESPQWSNDYLDSTHRPLVLLGCWIVGCTLFLSLSHSKLVTYLWPVFPAVAILAAVAWARLLDGTLSPGAKRLLAKIFYSSCLGGPLVMPAALLVVQRQFDVRLSAPVWAAVAIVSLAAWIPFGFWIARRCRATLLSAVAVTACQFVFVMTAVLPQVAGERSTRDLAAYLRQNGPLPSRVLMTDERLGSIIFYLGRETPADMPREPVQSIPLEDMLDPDIADVEALVVISERQVPRADEHDIDLSGIPFNRVGRYRLYRPATFVAKQETVAEWR